MIGFDQWWFTGLDGYRSQLPLARKRRAFIGKTVVVMAAGKASESLCHRYHKILVLGTNLVLIQVMEMKERRARKSKVEKGEGKGGNACYFIAKLYPTFCNPVDKPRDSGSSPGGGSVHGISEARILEWVAISSSRGSSQTRDLTQVSCVSCIGRQILYYWISWEAWGNTYRSFTV